MLITNLTFNLKIFEEILFHLHGEYKQGIQDKGDPISKISQLKTSWQIEIDKQMNKIPQNMNLLCYNTVEKAISVMSKILNLV